MKLSVVTLHNGKWADISDLLAAGTHKIEAWGNAREGYYPYLVSVAQPNIGLNVGRGTAERRLRDLRETVAQQYRIRPEDIRKGRGWLD